MLVEKLDDFNELIKLLPFPDLLLQEFALLPGKFAFDLRNHLVMGIAYDFDQTLVKDILELGLEDVA